MLVCSFNPYLEQPLDLQLADIYPIVTTNIKTGFAVKPLTNHPVFTKCFEPISNNTTVITTNFKNNISLNLNFTIEVYFNSGEFTESSRALLSTNSSGFDLYFFGYVTGNYIRFRRGSSNYIDSPLNVLQPQTDYHLVVRCTPVYIEMILNGTVLTTVTTTQSIASFSSLSIGSQSYYGDQKFLQSYIYYANIYNHFVRNSILFDFNRIKTPAQNSPKVPIIFLENDLTFSDASPTNKHINGKVQKKSLDLKSPEKATVYLLNSKNLKIERVKLTNNLGEFLFKHIPIGTYHIFSQLHGNAYNSESVSNIEIK